MEGPQPVSEFVPKAIHQKAQERITKQHAVCHGDVVQKVMVDKTKWPYKGHMNPGDHDDFPEGCKGNCDGVCEGYAMDKLVELLESEEGGHMMAVKKIIRLEDENRRYKAMMDGLEAKARQAEIERDEAQHLCSGLGIKIEDER